MNIQSILLDEVISQLQLDFENGDITAIEELLGNLSEAALKSYLSEGALSC